MVAEVRIRRAAAGAAVLLLHVLVLLVLLAAFQPHLFREVVGVREITISLPVTPQAEPPPPPETAPPTLIAPEAPELPPHGITLAPPMPIAPPQPSEQQGDIRALGRYLYNCSGAYYESLSPREKEHCLENKFNGQEGPALTLGPAKPSPFDAVIAKRNAPFVPIEKPCPVDKPTANLGFPCFDFGGAHAPLVEFHH